MLFNKYKFCLSLVLTITAFLIFFALLVFFMYSSDNTYIVVQTNNGFIRGKSSVTTFNKKEYFSFKGIRYAEPPINELRFLSPHFVKPWEGTHDALKHGSKCLQRNQNNHSEILGNEDCLFLNVYTTDVNPLARRAVMVFIHGGRFIYGSGNDDFHGYSDYHATENIVLVTINYRLGPFGFMSLGTPEHSGNMGLKDQLLALKWISANIHNFGGDKKRMVILGHNAGAASVHLLTISQGSRGLFKRAIAMSGTALNVWTMTNEISNHLDEMYRFVKQNNNQTGLIWNYDELVTYLKQIDGKELISKLDDSYPSWINFDSTSKWGPIVEDKNALQPFLQKSPEEIILNRSFTSKVDIMFGTTSSDMLASLSPFLNNNTLLDIANIRMEFPFPDIYFIQNYTSPEYRRAVNEIRKFYFGRGGRINNKTIDRFENLCSDINVNVMLDKSVRASAVNPLSKTFYYIFSVVSSLNYFKNLTEIGNLTLYGADQSDILCYFFKCNIVAHAYDGLSGDSIERSSIRNVSKFLLNFLKYGNPTAKEMDISLKPVTTTDMYYVNITGGGLFVDKNPFDRRMNFWNYLLEKYSFLMDGDD